jgi:hypothetical protein
MRQACNIFIRNRATWVDVGLARGMLFVRKANKFRSESARQTISHGRRNITYYYFIRVLDTVAVVFATDGDLADRPLLKTGVGQFLFEFECRD